MKKTLCLFLTLVLVAAIFVGCGNIDDTEDLQESPVEDFEYEISEDGERVIITKYIGSSDHVVIPSQIENLPVRTIKGYEGEKDGLTTTIGAFENSSIKSVVIPDSVRFIYRAFVNCKELKEVVFGKNSELWSISWAFQNCISLEEIDLSTTKLEEIDVCCFEGCTALKEVKFCDTIKSIEKKAFSGCESLEEIVLPKDLEALGSLAFENCHSLKKVTIPEKLDMKSNKTIPAFRGLSSLEQMIFEEGREEISSYAFAVIDTDAEIIIPDSVKRFSNYTFMFMKSARLVFLGNCPEILDADAGLFYEIPTIYYDPMTDGWTDCIWKENYTVIPKE